MSRYMCAIIDRARIHEILSPTPLRNKSIPGGGSRSLCSVVWPRTNWWQVIEVISAFSYVYLWHRGSPGMRCSLCHVCRSVSEASKTNAPTVYTCVSRPSAFRVSSNPTIWRIRNNSLLPLFTQPPWVTFVAPYTKLTMAYAMLYIIWSDIQWRILSPAVKVELYLER